MCLDIEGKGKKGIKAKDYASKTQYIKIPPNV